MSKSALLQSGGSFHSFGFHSSSMFKAAPAWATRRVSAPCCRCGGDRPRCWQPPPASMDQNGVDGDGPQGAFKLAGSAAAGRAVRCQDRRLPAWSCTPQRAQKAIYGCTVHRLYGAAAAPQRLLVLNMQAKSQPLSNGPLPFRPPAPLSLQLFLVRRAGGPAQDQAPGSSLASLCLDLDLQDGREPRDRSCVPEQHPVFQGRSHGSSACDGRGAQGRKTQNTSRPGPTARARACNQVLRV